LSWKKYKDALLHATFDEVPSVPTKRCNFGKGGKTHPKKKKNPPNFCDLNKIHDFKKWRIKACLEQIVRMHKRKVARLVPRASKKLDFLGKFTEIKCIRDGLEEKMEDVIAKIFSSFIVFNRNSI
jgi:hypothetical protein